MPLAVVPITPALDSLRPLTPAPLVLTPRTRLTVTADNSEDILRGVQSGADGQQIPKRWKDLKYSALSSNSAIPTRTVQIQHSFAEMLPGERSPVFIPAPGGPRAMECQRYERVMGGFNEPLGWLVYPTCPGQ